tara:strand:- start:126 stop:593 length:468 start_codon:yes stop_codon:yes gene_type:complete
VHARAPIYYWVDRYGNLHATDRIEGVPVFYLDDYEKRGRDNKKNTPWSVTLRQKKQEAKQTTKPTSANPPKDTETVDSKTMVELGRVRVELRDANESLKKLDERISALRFNPILRETPAVKNKVSMVNKKRIVIVNTVEKLKKELEVLEKEVRKR